ncbi:hypothetical protein AA309_30335 [Microvirga vignae]|uniref:HNH nuclease domain-containing protein n=1 Tax=Microvirga vignae TaxID=1225564 RepID=A0A0H1R336_9HYPH|nr:hypothetical protein AA309_30335 [Microvirga vignae]
MHGSLHPRRINYGGEVWWLCKSGYYCNTNGKKLQRRIYEDNFAPTPPGYVAHHKDHNRHNSSPENLETMPHSEHTRHHQTGHALHPNQLAANSAEMRRRWASAPIHRVTCLVCRELFETRSLQAPRQFCSDRCQDRWRANRFAGETRNCEHCGQSYFAVRRAQRYCSKNCNSRAAQARLSQPQEDRTHAVSRSSPANAQMRGSADACVPFIIMGEGSIVERLAPHGQGHRMRRQRRVLGREPSCWRKKTACALEQMKLRGQLQGAVI